MRKLFYICTAACLLLSCAGEVVNEYCNMQCHFIFDNQYNNHDASPLASVLNGTNTFAMVSIGNKGERVTVDASVYGGEKHSEYLTTEMEQRPSRQLGLSNGLVIGRSSLQDGALYVFDRQCPNCYNTHHNTRYVLQWAANGTQLHCTTCDRYYGLLNGGVVVGGENGEKLFRYHATYAAGLLRVINPS